jgi:hypothetical protein
MDAQAALRIEERTAVGVEPETVLPAQFFAGTPLDASLQPEKRLMLAVLEEAVGTFQKNALSPNRRARRLFTDVEEWLASEDREWPYSFVNICQALSLEPHYLRTGLRRWREREQSRGLSATNVVRFPFRRVNGRRHSITGRPVGLRRSA